MTSKIVVNNIEADSGINTITFINEVTAPTFNGNIVGTAATFSGNVDISGALTYEDVTNVDSVGIVTARSGIHVTGGNVGIGTDTPTSALEIRTTTTNAATHYRNNASNGGAYFGVRATELGAAGAGEAYVYSYNSGINLLADGNGDINFATGGTASRVRIKNNGNTGIGTDNPGTILDIRETKTAGSTQVRVYNTDNSNTITQTAEVGLSPDSRGLAGAGIKAFKENADFSTNAGRDISLALNVVKNNSQSEALRISSDGKLTSTRTSTTAYDSAVTTNDSGFLLLNHGAAGHATLQFQSLSGGTAQTGQATISSFNETAGSKNTALTFGTRQNSDATIRERLRITSSGNIGIGSDNPVTDLDISQKTESIVVPVGTDAQRSSSPVSGMLRYSTTSQKFEVYTSTWKTLDATTPVPTNGLISHWPLDGASINGSNYQDIIGGYDLAITGVTNSTDVIFGTAADWGSPDGNYYLKSASNSYYNFSSSPGLSISIWIKSDPNYGGTNPTHQWIVSEGTVNTKWNLFFEPNLKFRPASSGEVTTNTAASSYQDNNWHHVCCTYNSSNDAVVLYLDGVADRSGTAGTGAIFSGDYLLFGQHSTLSGNASSYRWRGKMAQCRIYNRVLNASEALLLAGEF